MDRKGNSRGLIDIVRCRRPTCRAILSPQEVACYAVVCEDCWASNFSKGATVPTVGRGRPAGLKIPTGFKKGYVQ